MYLYKVRIQRKKDREWVISVARKIISTSRGIIVRDCHGGMIALKWEEIHKLSVKAYKTVTGYDLKDDTTGG